MITEYTPAHFLWLRMDVLILLLRNCQVVPLMKYAMMALIMTETVLVDCEDEECLNNYNCLPDVQCEIISLISITQDDIQKIQFSFEKDGNLDHTLSRLDELGLTMEQTQGIINTMQTIRYDVQDVFLDGSHSFHDSIYLRMATMRSDFTKWKMNAYTKSPILPSTEFKSNYTLKAELATEKSCQKIIKILPPEECKSKYDLIQCSGIYDQGLGTGNDFSTIVIEFPWPIYRGKFSIYDLSEGMKLVANNRHYLFQSSRNKEILQLKGSGPFLIVARDNKLGCVETCIIEPDNCGIEKDENGQPIIDITINVTDGACIRIEDLMQKFYGCDGLLQVLQLKRVLEESNCIFVHSEDYDELRWNLK